MEMDLNEIFIDYLNDWIKYNWRDNKKTLAKHLGISPQHLSNFLTKKRRCGEPTRESICKALNLDYGKIIKIEKTNKNQMTNPNGKVYEFPVEYKPPPIDTRLAKMHENLDVIYKHGDDDLNSAIEMNLISFRKTVENQKEMSSMKEEIESLKKMISGHGS